MVGPRAGVAQDDLPALLAHFAVVLVVRLVAVAIVRWGAAEAAVEGPRPTAGTHPLSPPGRTAPCRCPRVG